MGQMTLWRSSSSSSSSPFCHHCQVQDLVITSTCSSYLDVAINYLHYYAPTIISIYSLYQCMMYSRAKFSQHWILTVAIIFYFPLTSPLTICLCSMRCLCLVTTLNMCILKIFHIKLNSKTLTFYFLNFNNSKKEINFEFLQKFKSIQ